MSKRDPAYTPMCNKHIRFYFSDPNRTSFDNKLSEKQFYAVQSVFQGLSKADYLLLEKIMPYNGNMDLIDSYIIKNLHGQNATKNEMDSFFILLRKVNYQIAINMEYITRKNGGK